MLQPLLSFSSPARSADLRLDGGDFASTHAYMEPLTEAGRKFLYREVPEAGVHFAAGSRGLGVRKSHGLDLAAKATAAGLVVA